MTEIGYQPTPVVATRSGQIRGYWKNGIHVFKGIPYGAPTGDASQRFCPPAREAAWSGVRDTFEYGDQSPQIRGSGQSKMFSSWRVQTGESEDCLRLNVWTPGLRGSGKRPIMVWFHGGGFVSLNGSSKAYEGTRLAKRGDVVVVTLNHRLNVFGYLYLGELDEEGGYAQSGVVGQLDLIAALKWVREHAEEFGGDADNVTIFGESGGGAKVCTLLAMPAAQGLFHRAAIQSGPMLRGVPRSVATENTLKLMHALGLDRHQVPELSGLPAAKLVEAFAKVLAETRNVNSFAPVVDGQTLPRDPFEPDASAVSAHVPVIVGYNRDETSLFATDDALFELSWDSLLERLQKQLKHLAVPELIANMRTLRPDSSPSQLYWAITTSQVMGNGSIRIAERKSALHANGAAPAYLYVVEWDTPVQGGRYGSPHSVEIPLVFDNVADSESMLGSELEAPQRVADQMSETWLAFARTGDPNNASIPHWAPYDLAQRATMVFDVQSRAVDDHRSAERVLFDRTFPTTR